MFVDCGLVLANVPVLVLGSYIFLRTSPQLSFRYCTSTQADEILYPYCPKEYREEDYRMQMVAREIREHGADLIMLQVTPRSPGRCWWPWRDDRLCWCRYRLAGVSFDAGTVGPRVSRYVASHCISLRPVAGRCVAGNACFLKVPTYGTRSFLMESGRGKFQSRHTGLVVFSDPPTRRH